MLKCGFKEYIFGNKHSVPRVKKLFFVILLSGKTQNNIKTCPEAQ